jgi:hypothetical protein
MNMDGARCIAPALVFPCHHNNPRILNTLLVHEYANHCILLPETTHVLAPASPAFDPVFDLDALHDEQERPPVVSRD